MLDQAEVLRVIERAFEDARYPGPICSQGPLRTGASMPDLERTVNVRDTYEIPVSSMGKMGRVLCSAERSK